MKITNKSKPLVNILDLNAGDLFVYEGKIYIKITDEEEFFSMREREREHFNEELHKLDDQCPRDIEDSVNDLLDEYGNTWNVYSLSENRCCYICGYVFPVNGELIIE